jgi:hypothetical protein
MLKTGNLRPFYLCVSLLLTTAFLGELRSALAMLILSENSAMLSRKNRRFYRSVGKKRFVGFVVMVSLSYWAVEFAQLHQLRAAQDSFLRSIHSSGVPVENFISVCKDGGKSVVCSS